MPELAKIGSSSRSGQFTIMDTALVHEYLLKVTVRENIGGQPLTKKDLRAMRDLARRAVPGKAMSCRRRNTYRTSYGCTQVNFEFILALPTEGEWGDRPLGPKS